MAQTADSHEQRDDTPTSSDQMPEEAPAHQVAKDAPGSGEGAARESGRSQADRHSHNPHEPRHKAPERSSRGGGQGESR